MQTFIFGLLMACVSGVTVVAFKYPNGFAKLFPFLFAVATALFVCLTVWHIAVETTWTNLLKYMAADTLPDASTVLNTLLLPYSWIALWYLGVVAFLWINLRLPPFLQNSDEHATSVDEEKLK